MTGFDVDGESGAGVSADGVEVLHEARELSEHLGGVLREREATLAVAESCTGGLVGSIVTDVPGSSDYFDRGLVTYSYDSKRAELAVSREALDEHGAVSEPVAGEMARSVRDVADATWGLATTGVAGPNGGTDENPVGTVYVGIAYAAPWESGESFSRVERHVFDGSRVEVKAKITRRAFRTLLAAVQETPE